MNKSTITLLAAVPLLALGLAACSSDPEPVTPVTSSPASTAPATPTESASTAAPSPSDSSSASPSSTDGFDANTTDTASTAAIVGVTANEDTKSEAVTLANTIVESKMLLVDAQKAITDAGFTSRVVLINGEPQAATMDYNPDRFDLAVEGALGQETVTGIVFG